MTLSRARSHCCWTSPAKRSSVSKTESRSVSSTQRRKNRIRSAHGINKTRPLTPIASITFSRPPDPIAVYNSPDVSLPPPMKAFSESRTPSPASAVVAEVYGVAFLGGHRSAPRSTTQHYLPRGTNDQSITALHMIQYSSQALYHSARGCRERSWRMRT